MRPAGSSGERPRRMRPGDGGDVEAEGAERGAEEEILFVAVAAAAVADEFAFDAGKIDRDAAAEEDVEILERNRGHLAELERAEGGERGVARAGVGEAGEVGVEVDGVVCGGHIRSAIRGVW